MIMLVLLFLGICLGSFVNALVWRIYKQWGVKSPKQRAKYSISHGRSMCINCGHTLAVKDLIPLVSWASLGGKCRYCRKPISWQYPVVELLTGAIFVLSYALWPESLSGYAILQFGTWLIILTGFMALTVYDLRWFILPNRIIYPLLFIATAQNFVGIVVFDQGMSLLWGILGGLVVGSGLFASIYFVSKGKWIGFGDVRLGALIGVVLASPVQMLLVIFLSSVIGTLVSIPLLLTGKARQSTKLPYGPFLIVATVIVRLFGISIVAWYKRQIGI